MSLVFKPVVPPHLFSLGHLSPLFLFSGLWYPHLLLSTSGAHLFCLRPVVPTSSASGLWGTPSLFSLGYPFPRLFLGLRCPPLLLTACCAPHLCFRPVVLPYFVFSPVVLPSSALDPLFRATDFHFVPHPTCRIEN